MRTTLITFVIFFGLYSNSSGQALNLYYGLLHAHTAFSDGSGTPEEAYKMAKDSGLNFFAVTPHNHKDAERGAKERTDGVLIANNHSLYNGTGEISVTQRFSNGATKVTRTKSVIGAANAITGPKFLGLYGQEFSTISTGNHMNVFGVETVLENKSGDFRSLFKTLAQIKASGKPVPVVQLNHPDVQADLFSKMNATFHDYGIDAGDLGPHFKDWVKAVDEYVALVEILSGPAMKDTSLASYHYKNDHENDYYFYLTQGLHVSPSVGQDNHYKNWGSATPARTGIYAKSLSRADVLYALRSNRTFATEDKNMAVKFWINGHFMGDEVIVRPDEELTLKVSVTDTDEPAASYWVTLVSGLINPDLSTNATRVLAKDGILGRHNMDATGEFFFSPLVAPEAESFFYVVVKQEDDDMAWSAPVWVSPSATPPAGSSSGDKFFWTKNSSKYYHLAGCPSVKLIKPENLLSGNVAPSNKVLHNCKIAEDAEEEQH